MSNQQASQPQVHEWFKSPRGQDAPGSVRPATCTFYTCHLVLNGSHMIARARFVPDSQQPIIQLRPTKRMGNGLLVLPLQDCTLTCGIEDTPKEFHLNEWVKKQRSEYFFLQAPEMERVVFHTLKLDKPPVKLWSETVSKHPSWQFLYAEMQSGAEFTMWMPHRDDMEESIQETVDWMRTLQTHLSYWSPRRKAYWWYHQPQPKTVKEGTAGPSRPSPP
ncbi:hypothetical protein BDW74DRAFT_183384 [Aspergillus multicolor]|uniref:uncharacterized protein n=1 Tax=Aspergillus multicolor TaxID=41759 RepID=UPI003CCD47FD